MVRSEKQRDPTIPLVRAIALADVQTHSETAVCKFSLSIPLKE